MSRSKVKVTRDKNGQTAESSPFIQNGLPSWCQVTQVVLEKRPLNRCSCSSSSSSSSRFNFCGLFCVLVSVCVLLLCFLDLVSSVLCQEIGWEERLRNDLFYVEWDVKP